jgi:hypothetical protein
MSANRSVQAAQKRRAGPTEPSRGPQPSINSSQMFAQARPGQGPPINSGRLAGQHAALQQQQMQQQMHQNQNQNHQQKEGLNSVTKMSIPQAITLITLRLGALETKIFSNGAGSGAVTVEGVDSDIVSTILSRLDALEQQEHTSSDAGSSAVGLELQVFKQQMEKTLQQTKALSTKENASLKTQLEACKKEIKDLRETLVALQNLTMENTQKLLDLSSGTLIEDIECEEEEEGEDVNELVGDDLKQFIESEINLEE